MSQFLIADDSPSKIDYLVTMVSASDIDASILIANTSESAKQLIDDYEDIAFAFIDYEIPTENGPAIISHLRSKFADAKIACVTGATNKAYEQTALQSGANSFVSIAKPANEVEWILDDLLLQWNIESEHTG